MKPELVDADYFKAAKDLNCEVAAIRAVFLVEAPRGGFNADGTPATLFEGHQFHRLTGGRFSKTHPTLSYPAWTRKFYGRTWQEEKARLTEAVSLDRDAALMATSWGKAQVMGFNYRLVGFATLQQFVNAMYSGERAHLEAFVQYVIRSGLSKHLQSKDWEAFSSGYNGPGYRVNNYHLKIANAYRISLGSYPL